jgi:hypothetical protein
MRETINAVEISLATAPGRPDRENEDFAAATSRAFVVLDGVTPGPEDDGCRHGVPWFVNRLGLSLVAALTATETAPALCLAAAIAEVAASHADTCDLTRQTTPQATVAAGRIGRDSVEYLVLSDCSLVIDRSSTGDGIEVVTDDRVEHTAAHLRRRALALPEGSPEREAARRRYAAEVGALRNRPGGFWTAAADPEVAAEALVGTIPRDGRGSVAAMTDGAARFVDVLDIGDWPDLMKVLADPGPEALIDQIRAAELADSDRRRHRRGKISDDATVLHIRSV